MGTLTYLKYAMVKNQVTEIVDQMSKRVDAMEKTFNARIDKLEKSIKDRIDVIEKTMHNAENNLEYNHKTDMDAIENRLMYDDWLQ